MVPIRCSSSVHHVDGEDLLFLAPLAQKGYGVSRGHVLPNGNQAGGHYSAARIFRMGHEPAYFVRLYDIHQPQDSFAAVLGQISQYVGSVVRCHFLPPGRRGFLRPASRQFCARYGNPPWQASLQPGVWPLAPGPRRWSSSFRLPKRSARSAGRWLFKVRRRVPESFLASKSLVVSRRVSLSSWRLAVCSTSRLIILVTSRFI